MFQPLPNRPNRQGDSSWTIQTADVVKLVDTPSWGGGDESHAGSSPAIGTINVFVLEKPAT